MGDLSPHFSLAEFADRRTGHVHRPPQQLLDLLEAIRALSGKPLRIVSGTRSASTNRAVGGARRSRHLVGDAADIPAGRVTVPKALELGAKGVGELRGWVTHVDVRPGKARVWRYR